MVPEHAVCVHGLRSPRADAICTSVCVSAWTRRSGGPAWYRPMFIDPAHVCLCGSAHHARVHRARRLGRLRCTSIGRRVPDRGRAQARRKQRGVVASAVSACETTDSRNAPFSTYLTWQGPTATSERLCSCRHTDVVLTGQSTGTFFQLPALCRQRGKRAREAPWLRKTPPHRPLEQNNNAPHR